MATHNVHKSNGAVYKLGLTGSIGMGKSTVAQMFLRQGIPLWDADKAVHELYSAGGGAVGLVGHAFPGCVVDNAVSRPLLAPLVVGNEEGIKKLESIVHPLVTIHRQKFLQSIADQKLVVLDIPLLFETHGEDQTDGVAVVSAPQEVQQARVLARPDMTPVKFQAILKRQVPDEEKRQRADFVIDTSVSLEDTQQQVASIISKLQQA
ncbi:hypothetical protein WJX77_004669 [Trebouxia sp. C0004]